MQAALRRFDAVLIGTGIVLSNDGLIEAASGNGAYINGGTIINAGTIAGGAGDDAVHFGSLDGTLVVVAGGVFQGQVAANHAAQDALVFGGTPSGTFTTDDGRFTGFSDFNLIDVNANWRVRGQAGGYGVRIGAGTILTNAGTIAGSGTAAGVYINGGELVTTGEVDGAGLVAVQFGSLSGTLALDANAIFTGSVVANRAAADALIFFKSSTAAAPVHRRHIFRLQQFFQLQHRQRLVLLRRRRSGRCASDALCRHARHQCRHHYGQRRRCRGLS